MKSFAQTIFCLLLALLPLAFAQEERSTVYLTRTVKKVTTHTVTASVYSTPVYSSSSVPTYSSYVYTSSAPVYSSSVQTYSSYAPTYTSKATYSSYAPPPYHPTGGKPTPTTLAPSYTAPSGPSTPAPTPTGAAGQVGANVLLAGLVAGVGAMML